MAQVSDLTDVRTPLKLKAIIREIPKTNVVVLNEVGYRNNGVGDWVELYNNSDQPVDISGFGLKD